MLTENRIDHLTNVNQLTGRQAQCANCRRVEPSNLELVFFEYRGPGSSFATQHCAAEVTKRFVTGRCGMRDLAHNVVNPATGRPGITDHPFTPSLTGHEFDGFYCGCR